MLGYGHVSLSVGKGIVSEVRLLRRRLWLLSEQLGSMTASSRHAASFIADWEDEKAGIAVTSRLKFFAPAVMLVFESECD